jgi:hypothetical protein
MKVLDGCDNDGSFQAIFAPTGCILLLTYSSYAHGTAFHTANAAVLITKSTTAMCDHAAFVRSL